MVRIALLFALLVLLVPQVATGSAGRRPTLQAQVKSLQRQVAALTKQVNADRQLAKDRDDCVFALTQDGFRSMFDTVAQVVALVTDTPPAPDLPRWDDKGACARAGIARPGP